MLSFRAAFDNRVPGVTVSRALMNQREEYRIPWEGYNFYRGALCAGVITPCVLHNPYSDLSAVSGSTRVARRAGR